MTKITKLTFVITTLLTSQVANSGPCYTDVGCDMSDQVIMITPPKTGAGFCTEYVNEENNKERKCYFQPAPLAITDLRETKRATIKNLPPIFNINLVHTESAEPVIYYVPYENRNDQYYNGYRNGYYDSYEYYRKLEFDNSNSSNHADTSPPQPTGFTITKDGGHSNISREDYISPPSSASSTKTTRSFSGGGGSGSSNGRVITK